MLSVTSILLIFGAISSPVHRTGLALKPTTVDTAG